MSEWTFITRHGTVLSLVAKHSKITAIELAHHMGITERAVRKIIADLYATGYIGKKREGRGIRYTIDPALSLRQTTHREVAIGDLLNSLGWERDD
ncbi:MAG: HTH domain-containing protein [Dehalococcoidales bacterium]|nr:HTH domain-containing protein [Dehalococcoidales bacterium]